MAGRTNRPLALLGAACLATPLGACGECRTDEDCPAGRVCASRRCVLDVPDVDGDGDVDVGADADADAESGVDADAHGDPDAEWDFDVPEGPRPEGDQVLTPTTIAFVSDLTCDIDGDGEADNGFNAWDPMVRALLATAITYAVGESQRVAIIDLHLVDDPETPHDLELPGAILAADDLDLDPSDNWSGLEPFEGHGAYYDGGAIRPDFVSSFSLDRGLLRGRVGRFPVHTPVDDPELGATGVFAYHALLTARLSPGMWRLRDGRLCGVFLPANLAAFELRGAPGYTWLEAFVAPASVFGLPGVVGAQPDVDLDPGGGDGLERYAVDESGHVSACVDGDGTLVEGRGCPLEAGFVDGFSFVLAFDGVSAFLQAPPPG